MEALTFNNIIQFVYCIAGIATLVSSFIVGTKYTPFDRASLKVIFVIGLIAGVLSTMAIAGSSAVIMGVGLFFGCFMVGLALGMNAERRGLD